MVRDLRNLLSMGPDNRLTVIRGQIEYIQRANRRPTRHLARILTERDIGHNTIIRRLQRILREAHGPDPQQLILPTGHTEPRTDGYTRDRCVIMQLIHLLKFPCVVVDLEQ